MHVIAVLQTEKKKVESQNFGTFKENENRFTSFLEWEIVVKLQTYF